MNYPDDCPPNRKDAPWNAPDEEEWVCDSLAVCSWCSELKETNDEDMCEECFKSKLAEGDKDD
jgi:hypothetical protein